MSVHSVASSLRGVLILAFTSPSAQPPNIPNQVARNRVERLAAICRHHRFRFPRKCFSIQVRAKFVALFSACGQSFSRPANTHSQ